MIVAIFDFCETVIKYQTADKFIDYVLEHSKSKSLLWINVSRVLRNRYFNLLTGKFFPKLNYGKRLKLLSIRGVEEKEFYDLAHRYALLLSKDYINEIHEKINWHKQQGHHLILISGGYEPYLKSYKEILGFDEVMGSKVNISNHFVSGKMQGADCMFEEKVNRFNDYIKLHNIHPERLYCYTDSITDLPILQIANCAVVVSKAKPQAWAKKYSFEEIIWQ